MEKKKQGEPEGNQNRKIQSDHFDHFEKFTPLPTPGHGPIVIETEIDQKDKEIKPFVIAFPQ
ncbi:MAG: hypothetical protein WCK34_00565 [Bacteroidota bacterium]